MGLFDFMRRNLIIAKPNAGGATQAEWTTWTVDKAVKEGFKVNSWVHRAVHLIATNAAQVPFVVRDEETGEIQPENPIHQLLQRPHPQLSRQKMTYLLATWIELAGNGYWKRVAGSGGTAELWPISPDRLAPIAATSLKDGALVDGYSIKDENGQTKRSEDFTPENVIHFKLPDPANPIIGIGRLQAAGKAVDLDNSQMGWNLSAMENRGVPDGVLSVKDKLTPDAYNAIVEALRERVGGSRTARQPIVVGADSEFHRMSLTPAEVDFVNSRKMGREEIFIVFGVPPQLAGAQEQMTYSNFASSIRIFWRSTVLPLVGDMADTLNTAFRDELQEGLRIDYDASKIEALRDDEEEKAKVARAYWQMGIPVEQISNILGLGVEEFEGWDKPFTGRYRLGEAPAQERAEEGPVETRARRAAEFGWSLVPNERRAVEDEQKRRDELAEGPVQSTFAELMAAQRDRVLEAAEAGQTEFLPLIQEDRDEWLEAMNTHAHAIAQEFAGTVMVNERGRGPRLAAETRDQVEDTTLALITAYLDEEQAMLQDLSGIEETTAKLITEQVAEAAAEGWAIQKLRQALEDVGVYSEARSLMLSRTLAGTSASIGQLAAAQTVGAVKKGWSTAYDTEVRSAHQARAGEEVGIDDTFSLQVGWTPPRFPLDPRIAAGDRIHCRCSMFFS
ncbi:MAG TPA: phage portal protein [Gammaproteobacteria bacterium]|nr:phage portal protein [Gammaproteobacteria bacterium]